MLRAKPSWINANTIGYSGVMNAFPGEELQKSYLTLKHINRCSVEEFPKKNDSYVATFDKGYLPLPPSKKLTIVTCMDARIDPAASLGIELGEAHVIRNAGGSAKEALRSIVISQRLLGTREVAVFHHTDCGMLTFTTEQLRGIVKHAAPDDTVVATAVDKIDFLEFGDLEESIKTDVEFLKKNELVLAETKVTGWVYDVKTGKVSQVI